jgi:hypothetical protein
MASPGLTRPVAQRILQTLGESGTPPERGVRFLNVGNESYLDVLRREYLEGLLPAGGSTFKLVQAYFGGGKTHFLLSVREMAWQTGFAAAYVGLSPTSCPFHEPLQVYRAVVRSLRAPPPDEAPLAPTTGLTDLLRDLIEDRRERAATRPCARGCCAPCGNCPSRTRACATPSPATAWP